MSTRGVRYQKPTMAGPSTEPGEIDNADRVGAVVVSFHTGPVLFDSLAALLADPLVGEVVVLDNGNPQDVVERLGALARGEPRLRLVTGQGNIGFAAACNRGAALCRAPFLLLVNPDCVVAPGTIEGLVAGLRRQPRAALCSPRLVGPDGSDQRGTPRNTLTPWIALVEALRLDRLAPKHPYFQRLNLHEGAGRRRPGPVPAVSGALMLMRRNTFAEFGGFDERYFLHMEDLDLCLRVLRAGRQILFLPGLHAVHHGSTSAAPFWFVEWHKALGAHKYFHRHFRQFYPAAFLWLVSGLLYARFALRVIARAPGALLTRKRGG